MHLRTTHAPKEGKYDYLTKDGEYAETPRIKTEAERREEEGLVEDVPEDGSRIIDVTDTPKETLAGLEPETPAEKAAAEAKAQAEAAAEEERRKKEQTALAAKSFMGKTLVLGVGKRIQDVKHKIWVASVHDPYSFRGPEDKAAGGGQMERQNLQTNGAPRGWSAPTEGQASVNQDENCVIC